MTLQIVESLSLPGDAARANEDSFGHGGEDETFELLQ